MTLFKNGIILIKY